MPNDRLVSLELFKWVLGGVFAFLVVLIGIVITAFDRMEDKNAATIRLLYEEVQKLEKRVRALETQRAHLFHIPTPGPR